MSTEGTHGLFTQDTNSLKRNAARLVKAINQQYDETQSVGSFSCTVYDTAWVSMISKSQSDDGNRIWLFPSCFLYVLEHQQSDGGWNSYGCAIDGIMNTAAALLALCHHRRAPRQLHSMTLPDFDLRIERARVALGGYLKTWDVGATLHVGYEILVPNLLRLLAEFGLTFEFPGQQRLLELCDQKMARFDPEILYDDKQISALHSLEAFIGRLNFDRLKHHTRFGSMLASSSSTAAYLIHSTTWDIDAESYLRRAIAHGEGNNCGGLPSAFPSTYFEMTWVSSYDPGRTTL